MPFSCHYCHSFMAVILDRTFTSVFFLRFQNVMSLKLNKVKAWSLIIKGNISQSSPLYNQSIQVFELKNTPELIFIFLSLCFFASRTLITTSRRLNSTTRQQRKLRLASGKDYKLALQQDFLCNKSFSILITLFLAASVLFYLHKPTKGSGSLLNTLWKYLGLFVEVSGLTLHI